MSGNHHTCSDRLCVLDGNRMSCVSAMKMEGVARGQRAGKKMAVEQNHREGNNE